MGSLCAFGIANFGCYVRTVKDAAGAWIWFCTENRDLPVRKISKQHWELCMMDSTSNPYLFVAVILLAGLRWLSKKTDLAWVDCNIFPNLLDEGQRAKYGLDKVMSSNFPESIGIIEGGRSRED
jgi:glutamine synthetase